MDSLDKYFATGLPVFDLNWESLGKTDWSKTPLGPREDWSPTLKCLVNSCILPIPHCAALFWDHQLTVIHNMAWERARGSDDGQALEANDTYGNEALSVLRVALRGRSLRVAASFFLKNASNGQDSQVHLNPVFDDNGKRMGVLAQLLENATVEKYTSIQELDKFITKDQSKMSRDKDGLNMDAFSLERNPDSKQTQLFQRFAEMLPNGLAILDKDAVAVFVNDSFYKLTANKFRKEFRAWPESIHPEDHDRVMSAYREAFESRSELRIEFRCVRENKCELSGAWRLFLLRPLSEDPEVGFICAVVDITDIKEAQLAQEKAACEAQQRKEQQERFIDMVSHEIRNPLSAVLHLAEEVKEVTREIASTHHDIREQISGIIDAADTILLCVSHQNTLVDDILSFSKLDSMMLTLVPREVRPKWEFSKALRVFQSEFKAKGIKFHYAMDVSYDKQHIDHVVADLNRMNQVLLNLITNAIKFTARKKGERKITVSLGASVERPTSYPPNVIFFSDDKEAFHIDATMTTEWGSGPAMYIMVAVKDSGIGISRDGQAKLFERFRQATPKTQVKYGGSGLGLFISLCQLHGGDIGVSSKEGEGSTFGFFFKVRLSDGSSEDGRPPFQSRSNSGTSNASNRAMTPAPRPSFSRANSALVRIRESRNEQNEKPPLASHAGVETDQMDDSLSNPPTEYVAESHPASSQNERSKITESVMKEVLPTRPHWEQNLDVRTGQSERRQTAADKLSKKQSNQSSENKQTLLLVEDNLINQKVLQRQLQSRGFEVLVANNGQEAVDAVVERGTVANDEPNGRNYFDCILMDQEMPVKDGNAATEEIRVLQKEGKAGYSHILGVSANVREAQKKGMRDAGMDDVISKPFKVDDLIGRIASLISEQNHKKEERLHSSETWKSEAGKQVELRKEDKSNVQVVTKESQRNEDNHNENFIEQRSAEKGSDASTIWNLNSDGKPSGDSEKVSMSEKQAMEKLGRELSSTQ